MILDIIDDEAEEAINLDEVLTDPDAVTVCCYVKIRKQDVTSADWQARYARMRENAVNALDMFVDTAIADKGWK